jgi:hypothetical protein
MKNFKLFVKKNNNNKDKFNKNLLLFLINNVEELISSGIFVRIILVNNKNVQAIQQLNIKSTPALYCQESKDIIIGVNNIIQHFIDSCENGQKNDKEESDKKKSTYECTDVKDMLNEIIQEEDDSEDEEIKSDNIRQKMTERLNGISTENYSYKKTEKNFNRLKDDNSINTDSIQMDIINTGDTVGDEAMAKYWANLEETDI